MKYTILHQNTSKTVKYNTKQSNTLNFTIKVDKKFVVKMRN